MHATETKVHCTFYFNKLPNLFHDIQGQDISEKNIPATSISQTVVDTWHKQNHCYIIYSHPAIIQYKDFAHRETDWHIGLPRQTDRQTLRKQVFLFPPNLHWFWQPDKSNFTPHNYSPNPWNVPSAYVIFLPCGYGHHRYSIIHWGARAFYFKHNLKQPILYLRKTERKLWKSCKWTVNMYLCDTCILVTNSLHKKKICTEKSQYVANQVKEMRLKQNIQRVLS